MKSINRLISYLDHKDFKYTRFEKDVGLSNGYIGKMLRKNTDLGSSIIEKIIAYYPDLNSDWLLTGEGNMIKSIQNDNVPINCTSCPYKSIADRYERDIERYQKEIERLSRRINDLTSQPDPKTQSPLRLIRGALYRSAKNGRLKNKL